jgi:hypothetical protein
MDGGRVFFRGREVVAMPALGSVAKAAFSFSRRASNNAVDYANG